MITFKHTRSGWGSQCGLLGFLISTTLMLTFQSAAAETIEEFTAAMRTKLNGSICPVQLSTQSDISYDQVCGKIDAPGYQAGAWWQCSQKVDRANALIARWNDFIRQCRSSQQRRESSSRQERNTFNSTSHLVTVSPSVSGGILNMREGPGQGHALVTSIPAGTSGVAHSGNCASPDDGRSRNPWCQVQWNGHNGWVSQGGLSETRAEPAPPRQVESRPSTELTVCPRGQFHFGTCLRDGGSRAACYRAIMRNHCSN